MTRRTYTYNGFETTLSSPITDTSTTVVLASTTGLQAPGYLVFDPDSTTKREYVKFQSLSAPSLENVLRGLDGSISGAQAHTSGTRVRGVVTHQLIDDIFLDIGDVSSAFSAHDGEYTDEAHPEATTSSRGFMSAGDKLKLENIDEGAEVNQTDLEIRSQLLNVDGTGSGIDADMVDGVHADDFSRIVAGEEQGGSKSIITTVEASLADVTFTMPDGWSTALIIAWGGYTWTVTGINATTFRMESRLKIGSNYGAFHQTQTQDISAPQYGAMVVSHQAAVSGSTTISMMAGETFFNGTHTVYGQGYVSFIAIRTG